MGDVGQDAEDGCPFEPVVCNDFLWRWVCETGLFSVGPLFYSSLPLWWSGGAGPGPGGGGGPRGGGGGCCGPVGAPSCMMSSSMASFVLRVWLCAVLRCLLQIVIRVDTC